MVADESSRQTTRLACTIQPGAIVGLQDGQPIPKGSACPGLHVKGSKESSRQARSPCCQSRHTSQSSAPRTSVGWVCPATLCTRLYKWAGKISLTRSPDQAALFGEANSTLLGSGKSGKRRQTLLDKNILLVKAPTNGNWKPPRLRDQRAHCKSVQAAIGVGGKVPSHSAGLSSTRLPAS